MYLRWSLLLSFSSPLHWWIKCGVHSQGRTEPHSDHRVPGVRGAPAHCDLVHQRQSPDPQRPHPSPWQQQTADHWHGPGGWHCRLHVCGRQQGGRATQEVPAGGVRYGELTQCSTLHLLVFNSRSSSILLLFHDNYLSLNGYPTADSNERSLHVNTPILAVTSNYVSYTFFCKNWFGFAVPAHILTEVASESELVTVQNQTININCPAMGIPSPSIIWLKNRVPLLDAPYKNMRVINNDQVLEISNAQLEDAGKYSCTVTNVAGQEKREFNLQVHGEKDCAIHKFHMKRFYSKSLKFLCT